MDPILNEESTGEIQEEAAEKNYAESETRIEAETNAESQPEPSTKPRTEPRRKRRKKNPFPIPAFLTHLGEDVRWYYDIRLWSPLLLLLFILALLPGKQTEEKPVETVPEATAVETLPEVETTPTEAAEEVIPEAEALARLADCVGAGRSNNVKTVIMWVAINRSEDRANGYGQSLLDEIARPNQWQGFDPTALYSDGSYELAKQVLETQANGGLRPVDSDMLWFVLNDDGSITLRNQFTATANQKWREKTVK